MGSLEQFPRKPAAESEGKKLLAAKSLEEFGQQLEQACAVTPREQLVPALQRLHGAVLEYYRAVQYGEQVATNPLVPTFLRKAEPDEILRTAQLLKDKIEFTITARDSRYGMAVNE